jgi:hypothetical protein
VAAPRTKLLKYIPTLQNFIRDDNGHILLPSIGNGIYDEALCDIVKTVLDKPEKSADLDIQIEQNYVVIVQHHVVFALLGMEKERRALEEMMWKHLGVYELTFETIVWVWEQFEHFLESRRQKLPPGRYIPPYADLYIQGMAYQILNLKTINKLGWYANEYVYGNQVYSQPQMKKLLDERERKYGLKEGYEKSEAGAIRSTQPDLPKKDAKIVLSFELKDNTLLRPRAPGKDIQVQHKPDPAPTPGSAKKDNVAQKTFGSASGCGGSNPFGMTAPSNQSGAAVFGVSGFGSRPTLTMGQPSFTSSLHHSHAVSNKSTFGIPASSSQEAFRGLNSTNYNPLGSTPVSGTTFSWPPAQAATTEDSIMDEPPLQTTAHSPFSGSSNPQTTAAQNLTFSGLTPDISNSEANNMFVFQSNNNPGSTAASRQGRKIAQPSRRFGGGHGSGH